MDKKLLEQKANLIFEKLQCLQKPNEQHAEGVKGFYARDFGIDNWDWPQGVGLFGLYKLYNITHDEKVMDFLKRWFAAHRGNLPVKNINTTAPNLAYSFLENNSEMEQWTDWLLHGLPRTKDRGFQHTTTKDAALCTIDENVEQLWIDTLFMAVLFTANYGARHNKQDLIDEAVHQFLVHIKYLYNKANGLFYHGWSFIENNNFGGIFWCRGNCWFTMAVVELIDILGKKLNNGVKTYLIDTYRSQVEAILNYQDESGLWHTVIDDKDSYLEVSGSAGFAYGILKGIRLGIIDSKYLPKAEKAITAIINNIDASGTVLNVSAGTDMGMNANHYKEIMIAPMAYGQAIVLMALTEAMIA